MSPAGKLLKDRKELGGRTLAANGEVDISEFFKAVFFQYNGLLCISCRTHERGATWTFRAASLDLPILEEQYADETTAIYLKSWVRAEREVASFQSQAKRNMGIWISARYAEPRVVRGAP
jgi:hypothetical protein